MNELENIIKGFMKYLDARNIRSKASYLSNIKEFLNWCEEEQKEYLHLTDEEAESWLLSLVEQEKPLSRSTINSKLYCLKSFYLFLMKKKLINQHPFYYLKALRIGRQLPRDILHPTEMEKLLSCFPEMRASDVMIKCLMELLYSCALRISEAESIKLEDIDLISRTVIIFDHKNQKQRKVPLTEQSARLIHHYSENYRLNLLSTSSLNAGYLFPQGGKTALRCRLNQRLKTHCKRLGLKTLTSHSFRHSAATHLLKNGAGIRKVQAFLGHDSINSTQRYTHIEKDDLKSVVSNFHPREVLAHE